MPGAGRRDDSGRTDKSQQKQNETRKGPGGAPGGAGKGPDKNSGGGIPPQKKP